MTIRTFLRLSLGLGLIMSMRMGAPTPPANAAPQVIGEAGSDCVVLLHGLARTKASMSSIERALRQDGYRVVNQGYPSRQQEIRPLAMRAVPEALAACRAYSPRKIHFVTHSMGGILLRYYLRNSSIERLGRVVMLSPPNQGSELVDSLSSVPGFLAIYGPAGRQLGTRIDDVPKQLGPLLAQVGILAGNRSLNPIYSWLIPGEDDGKVSVSNTQLDGMDDFLVLPHSHTFIMRSEGAIRQVAHFLKHGKFER